MKKKKIFRTLIENYILFVVTVVLICIATAAFVGVEMTRNLNEDMLPKIDASMVVRTDYKNIDISDASKIGGWLEILDRDNNVIYTKGDKRTPQQKYGLNELCDLLGFDRRQEYVYSAKAFTGRDGQPYTCLLILPHDKVDLRLNLINTPYSITGIFLMNLLKGAVFFLILFMGNIYLYSRKTAEKIKNPLNRISEAIEEMSSGKSGVRMSFEAENEFVQIRDAFNLMAEKLEAAENEKEKMEQNRKRMFVDISHDLKTPITTISGYAKALSEGMVTAEEKKQRYLETIYEKSVRVTRLINNIFELAKLENTEPVFAKEKLDFAEFLRGIVAEHYEQLEEKGLILELKIPEEPVSFCFDKKEIGRIITNILSNAISYNPTGTRLRIGLSEIEDGIAVEIADNGTGIPEDMKDIVFEPFVRGDFSRRSDGTGLGLAIARKLAVSHGGTLRLYTNRGEDKTIFELRLTE